MFLLVLSLCYTVYLFIFFLVWYVFILSYNYKTNLSAPPSKICFFSVLYGSKKITNFFFLNKNVFKNYTIYYYYHCIIFFGGKQLLRLDTQCYYIISLWFSLLLLLSINTILYNVRFLNIIIFCHKNYCPKVLKCDVLLYVLIRRIEINKNIIENLNDSFKSCRGVVAWFFTGAPT